MSFQSTALSARDVAEAQALLHEKGWTDGLPVLHTGNRVLVDGLHDPARARCGSGRTQALVDALTGQ